MPPPNDLKARLIGHALRIVKEEAMQGGPLQKQAAEHLDKCQISGCGEFTLGAVCFQCSRHVCKGHLYASLTLPPEFHCAECIAAEFEVFRGDAPEGPEVIPGPSTKGKRP